MPYHLQINGFKQEVNQILVQILHNSIVDSKRDWNTKLTMALWAYRTTYKVTTQAISFSLIYRIDAILPIKFEVPLLQIEIDKRLDAFQSLKDKLEHLEVLSKSKKVAT